MAYVSGESLGDVWAGWLGCAERQQARVDGDPQHSCIQTKAREDDKLKSLDAQVTSLLYYIPPTLTCLLIVTRYVQHATFLYKYV